jgi:PAS domain S-box-containing protein
LAPHALQRVAEDESMRAECKEDTALHILVVEDDEGVNRLVRKQLARAGYTVQGVTTGRAALEKMEKIDVHDPFLILLDQKLPDMDGSQLVHTMVEQGHEIPFIVMTGQGNERLAVEMMKLGARDYVVKGVDFLDLLPSIVDRVAREIRSRVRLDRVQRSLNETEDRYRSILQTAMDGFWLVDSQGRILQVNASYCRMSGFTEDELLGMHISDLDACEDSSKFATHMRTVVEKGEDRFVTLHRRKDGFTFDVEISTQYRPEDQGRFIAFIRDISEQVKAERALRQSEGEKRLILESISNVVAFYDSPELNVVWTNREAGNSVGSSPVTLIGKKCHLIWADSDVPCEGCPVLQAFKTGRKTLREQTTPDGRIWSVSAYPAFNEFGLLKGVVEVAAEITQARTNEESLRRALDQITFLVENSPLAVIEWGSGNRATAWSERAEAIFGWSEAEAVGKNWRDLGLVPQEDLPEVETKIKEMLFKDSQRNIIRNRNLTRDGRIIHCVWYNSAFKDAHGKVVTILSQVEDVSAQKQTEKENKQLEMQVRQAQKLESVGRLAGGVAHDLNNLLSPILGYAEIVLDDTAPNDPRYASVEQIIGAGERARELVHQLLAFSRKHALQFVPVNLNDLLERFLRLLVRTIREDIDIELQLFPDLPSINADMGHLEQVIMNLAVNAQDAMPSGGRLMLKTDLVILDIEDAAGLYGVDPGQYVLLEITDTGEGMDKAVRDHIFEPFFTTKVQDKGTGLGLAMVYGIVKQHGGSIRVQSRPGQGASFFILFPVSEQDTKGPVQKAICPSRDSVRSMDTQKTVLLVEDNEQVRALVESILSREGMQLLVANDGLAGRELFATHQGRVDLLLTDVIMPGLNGRELYDELVNLQPDLKAIFMSGYTDDVIGPQGVLEEGIHFLQKPFSILTLKKLVHDVLEDTGEQGHQARTTPGSSS